MAYGCYNKPRPIPGAVTHLAPDGWSIDELSRASLDFKSIKHVMTTACQYTLTTPDKRCAGCVHEMKKE